MHPGTAKWSKSLQCFPLEIPLFARRALRKHMNLTYQKFTLHFQ
jgi:hypothetical protein